MQFHDGLEVLGTDERPRDGGLWCGVFEDSVVERVELPSTLKRIEYSAFECCKSLKSIALPDGLEHIGMKCFKDSALEEIRLPALKTIEQLTFSCCMGLKSVQFSPGLERIGIKAFCGTKLESVRFPSSLRRICQGAFSECNNLRTVVLNEGLEALGADEYPPKSAGFQYYLGTF